VGGGGYAAASFEPNGTGKSRVISTPSQVISFRHFPSLGPEVLVFSQLFSTCVEYYSDPTVIMESRSNKDPSCSKSMKRACHTDPDTN
jgi:hypothetical protein